VGLVWAGNPEHQDDRRRSIAFDQLRPLLQVPNVHFYSLQIEPRAPADTQVSDLAPHLTDFADTAAFISGLDLVITVDTATAHLAGALGRPVWTLLPFVPDWRWGLESADTPWYPSMRLFRQKTAGDWEEVIQRVAGELAAAAHAG
jgi:ADP-heptose:LPS heptosyltransferase